MKLFAIFLIVTIFPCWLMAQQVDPQEFQDGILLEQVSPQGVTILQPAAAVNPVNGMGLNYQQIMDILRSRVASAERENHITVVQDGDNNLATVNQEGVNNAIEVVQSGDGNLYEGAISGEENLIHILQSGHFNKLYQFVDGQGKELQVVQEGSNLELIQVETGPGAPAYQVHQKGEGMSIKIEHIQFP